MKLHASAKIVCQPHEDARSRNSMFDGYLFQKCNDGVSPQSFKKSPSPKPPHPPSTPSCGIQAWAAARVVRSQCAPACDVEEVKQPAASKRWHLQSWIPPSPERRLFLIWGTINGIKLDSVQQTWQATLPLRRCGLGLLPPTFRCADAETQPSATSEQ